MQEEYINRINKVLEFIQMNVDKKLSIQELANIAGFSPFHFHRIFSAFVGEPLSSFIKRVKLEKSAGRLRYTDTKITDIALEYGYEIPSAYTKAFKQLFGVSPSEYKAENNKILFINQNNLDINYLKELIMESFKGIKELDDLKVYYVRRVGCYQQEAPKAWETLSKFVKKYNLCSKTNIKMIGLCYDDPDITPAGKQRYDACINIDTDIQPEGEVGIQIIQGGKYAVFLHKGPYEDADTLYRSICAEWLPNSGCKIRDLPLFEVYLNEPQHTKPEDLLTEIYLPIESLNN